MNLLFKQLVLGTTLAALLPLAATAQTKDSVRMATEYALANVNLARAQTGVVTELGYQFVHLLSGIHF